MFDMNNSVFGTKIDIPANAKIIFVADMFAEDYVGGAELTSQSLIDSCPVELFKLHSRDVNLQLLQKGADRFWIFGNFAELNPQLIPSIIGNLKYSILEYDYKYCKARSPEKHLELSKLPCDCHNQMNGKLVSAFFYAARHLWWMSEKQQERYFTMFPFLAERDNTVLSSVLDATTLGTIKVLRSAAKDVERKGWLVLGSKSWVKGCEAAKEWCEKNNKDYEVVWDLPYHELLRKLSTSEGFVYLPAGADTCPRMVIEAKLLGCKLQLNDNVQHKNEEWFATDNIQEIEEYLYTAPKTFWNGIKAAMDYQPTISGYTTTYNCQTQKYPFVQCIKSMLEFCDEVCIVDGGSTDGTWETLIDLVMESKGVTLDSLDDATRQITIDHCKPGAVSSDKKLRIKQVARDWSSKRHPVFDGMQKAEARAMCSKEYCWQMDSDEVVHEDDGKKVRSFCGSIPPEVDIMALPVIEYWGGPDKVRLDVQPWKWRLSRNKPNITHGIPKQLRKTDSDGNLYAAEGTDGCDMIDAQTFESLPHVSFYTPDVENARRVAMVGNEQAHKEYQVWFDAVVANLPCVFHYSWYDLPRKIRLYRDYWQNHWNALWDKDTSDIAENNMMFDLPWSQITDEMIDARAQEMKDKLGGWIWHRKWDGVQRTPHITCERSQPRIMLP